MDVLSLQELAHGADFSVYQWFRDDQGQPLFFIDDVETKDIMAAELFDTLVSQEQLLDNPIDFKKMSTMINFAFIRTIDNTGRVDKAFDLNWNGIGQFGIPRGAYCNWVTGANMLKIAELFYQTAVKFGLGELPPILDYEPTIPANPKAVFQFLSDVNSLFKHPKGVIVYSSNNFWSQLKPTPTWMENNASIGKWVASWKTAETPTLPPGWKTYDFWQYTDRGNGSLYGVKSKQIDLDRFNGTTNDLKTWFRVVPTPKPSIEERIEFLERNATSLEDRILDLEIEVERLNKRTFWNWIFK